MPKPRASGLLPLALACLSFALTVPFGTSRLDAQPIRLGPEFQVSSYTTGHQTSPAVSFDAGGGFVVAWASDGQDGSSYGIFAQRFTTPNLFDIDGNGATGALTDGLLVLRYLFGFTRATLVTGAVDLANCIRCQAGPIETYLQTLL